MASYQVDILNPKADKLLQDLADLKLIIQSSINNVQPGQMPNRMTNADDLSVRPA